MTEQTDRPHDQREEEQYKAAHAEGVAAAKAGKDSWSCPYPLGTTQSLGWLDGYESIRFPLLFPESVSVEQARQNALRSAADGSGFTNPYPIGTPERKVWKETYEAAPKGVPQMSKPAGRSEDEMARDLKSATSTTDGNAAMMGRQKSSGPFGVALEKTPSGRTNVIVDGGRAVDDERERLLKDIEAGGDLGDGMTGGLLYPRWAEPMLGRAEIAARVLPWALDTSSGVTIEEKAKKAARVAVIAADALLEALYPSKG